MSTDAIKDKIAKLLAKAERTDNPHEAEAFSAKAEKLMLQWGVDAAELEAAGTVKPEEIVQRRYDYSSQYAIAMVRFAHNVAAGLGNLRTLQYRADSTRRGVYVIGHESDVDRFEMLMNSLWLQHATARKVWWRETAHLRSQYLTSWDQQLMRRSFMDGYSRTVGSRLFRARQEQEGTASPGAALVLVDKSERVNNWIDENLVVGTARSARQSGSAAALAAGHAAGETANLGEKRLGNDTKELD